MILITLSKSELINLTLQFMDINFAKFYLQL